jgi:ADP-heptose:LPS heptosyltransferase
MRISRDAVRGMPLRLSYPDIKRIMLITGARIGDQLLNTPFFRSLRKTFSQSRIECYSGYPAMEILRDSPYFDELRPLDRKALKRIAQGEPFDLAIDLCALPDTANAALLSNAKYRVGKKGIRLKAAGRQTEMFLSADELSEGREVFAGLGLREDDFVLGIFPCGSKEEILWPAERFGRLADKLAEQLGAKILFFCGKEERRRLKQVTSSMKNDYFFSGLHEIKVIASMLKLCRLVIASDRGPMHISAALQVPTIAIFGPYPESMFFPYKSDRNMAISKKLDCRPCFKGYHTCTNGIKCLGSLSVAEVFGKVKRFLGSGFDRSGFRTAGMVGPALKT